MTNTVNKTTRIIYQESSNLVASIIRNSENVASIIPNIDRTIDSNKREFYNNPKLKATLILKLKELKQELKGTEQFNQEQSPIDFALKEAIARSYESNHVLQVNDDGIVEVCEEDFWMTLDPTSWSDHCVPIGEHFHKNGYDFFLAEDDLPLTQSLWEYYNEDFKLRNPNGEWEYRSKQDGLWYLVEPVKLPFDDD